MGVVLLLLTLLLMGCKADLYSGLNEKEANQMLAVLMESGVLATKSEVNDAFSVQVSDKDIASAIAILTAKGLPKDRSASIGSIFEKSGIISSPFEDRVRYIYALGTEVAATLGEIDGVITARVHVVLPDQPQLGSPTRPSSAAVFIKHEPAIDLEYMVPQIRRLVSSSIEGLEYASVSVFLAEGVAADREIKTIENATIKVLPGLSVREADVLYFWRIIYVTSIAIAALILIILGFLAYLIFYRDGQLVSRSGPKVTPAGSPETL